VAEADRDAGSARPFLDGLTEELLVAMR
jgi:hypothetical protein